MATKPVTYPNIWDSAGIYATGPFIGSISKVDPGIGIAGEGHRPGSLYPTAAEHENFQQFQLTTWVRTWLALGSSAGAADAHILETNSVGRFAAVGATFVDAVDETVLDITGANTLAPAVLVTSGATCYQADPSGTGTGYSVGVASAATGYSCTMVAGGFTSVGVNVSADGGTSGVAINVAHAGSGAGVKSTATGTGLALDVIGSALALYGGRFVGGGLTSLIAEGVGTALGAIILSSATAGASALNALLANNTGNALLVNTPGGSTTAARGILSSVSGSAAAAELVAPNYYAAILTGDTTSPQYGPLFITQSNARPVVTTSGQIARVRSNFGVASQLMEACAEDAGWRGFLSTPGGSALAVAYTASATRNSAGTWGSLLSIYATGGDAPKTAGRQVLMRISMSARQGVAATALILNLRLLDITAGGGVVWTRSGTGSGAGAGWTFPTLATADWHPPIMITVPITVPADGDYQWNLEFGHATAGGVSLRDISVDFLGMV